MRRAKPRAGLETGSHSYNQRVFPLANHAGTVHPVHPVHLTSRVLAGQPAGVEQSSL